MKTKSKFLFSGALVIAILVVLVAWRVISNSHNARHRNDDAPLSVDTALVTHKPMPLLLLSVGQVQPEHSVQIRPQVSGVLKQVFFTEGQTVRAGQRLFQIDPAPYQAALASTKSAWDSAKANAARMAPLAAKDYVTPQEYQDAQTAADQAQAAFQQAQINLGYTDIRAPITGRTGSIAVKAGNVVGPSDTNPLVVINQMQPILVQFTIPQQQLPEVRKYQSQHPVQVFITREDGSGSLGNGKLVFIDNSVNPATGTVTLKAEIPNRQVKLWPGQFVGVKTQLAVQADALVIPGSAIQTGQDGNFVYAVIDGKAKVLPIKVDRQLGDLAVIADGLKGNERVITRVPRDLRPGLHVIPNVSTLAAPADAQVAP